MPPLAEYSHYSPTTLKAVITDYNRTNSYVVMKMYGYQPKDVPVDYKFYLPNNSLGTTEAPMSSLRRLKIFMNAEQQQQQRQQQFASEHFAKMKNPNEFGQQQEQQQPAGDDVTLSTDNSSANIVPHGLLAIYNLIFLVIAATVISI